MASDNQEIDIISNMFEDTITDDMINITPDITHDDTPNDTTENVVYTKTELKFSIKFAIPPKINIYQLKTLKTCIKNACTTKTTKTVWLGDDTETVQDE